MLAGLLDQIKENFAMINSCGIYYAEYLSSRSEVFCEKGFLKNVVTFTAKHLL